MGDYQRQLFLVDHAGLPLKTVLEQVDMLGEQVVPVLRREFAALQAGPRARGPDPRRARWQLLGRTPTPSVVEAARSPVADGR